MSVMIVMPSTALVTQKAKDAGSLLAIPVSTPCVVLNDEFLSEHMTFYNMVRQDHYNWINTLPGRGG